MKNLKQMSRYARSKGRMVCVDKLRNVLKAYTPVHVDGRIKLYDDSVIEELLPSLRIKKLKPAPTIAIQLELDAPDAPEVSQLDRIETLLKEVAQHLSLTARLQEAQD